MVVFPLVPVTPTTLIRVEGSPLNAAASALSAAREFVT